MLTIWKITLLSMIVTVNCDVVTGCQLAQITAFNIVSIPLVNNDAAIGLSCKSCRGGTVTTDHWLYDMSAVLSRSISTPVTYNRFCLQCFDAVGWATGRASGL